MPLRWLVLLLSATLVALLTIAVVRAKATRLHYQLSQLDRRASVLRQELREKELELVRLRNPAAIQARLAEFRSRSAFGG